MKVNFCLMMSRDGIGAVCSFDADVNWMAADLRDVDKMKGFKPICLGSLLMSYEDGSTLYYAPPAPSPKGVLERLRELFGIGDKS